MAENPVRELRERLDNVWRYGECLAQAEGQPQEQKAWRELQDWELACISHLRQLIFSRMEAGEFFEGL